jgi:hypothetical protein
MKIAMREHHHAPAAPRDRYRRKAPSIGDLIERARPG